MVCDKSHVQEPPAPFRNAQRASRLLGHVAVGRELPSGCWASFRRFGWAGSGWASQCKCPRLESRKTRASTGPVGSGSYHHPGGKTSWQQTGRKTRGGEVRTLLLLTQLHVTGLVSTAPEQPHAEGLQSAPLQTRPFFILPHWNSAHSPHLVTQGATGWQ